MIFFNSCIMTEVATLSSKGQLVIPKDIRKELRLNEGTQFIIFTDGSNILLKPIEKPSLSEFSILLSKSQDWAKSNE